MKISISSVIVPDRQRKDYGDISDLASSIKKYGGVDLVPIQPIVIDVEYYRQADGGTPNAKEEDYTLIAGGRRLAALKVLGVKELEHGRHFIYLDESNKNPLLRKAVELEENVRRKQLSWQEEVMAKQELLETMEKIYGPSMGAGGNKRLIKAADEKETVLQSRGFGPTALAAMLGVPKSQISQDLLLAAAMKAIPSLKTQPTKNAAARSLSVGASIVSMLNAPKPAALQSQDWTLLEGDFRDTSNQIPDESVDLVYTDIPYNVDLSSLHSHQKGAVSYNDKGGFDSGSLFAFASESFRILRADRFVVVWFSFEQYGVLVNELKSVGFTVNAVPFIWFKNTRTTEDPYKRYANSYEQALIAYKGSPNFLRPGQQNSISMAPIATGQKLQVAQQPAELVEKFIKDMCAPGSTICDFTAGSGTTGVAALRNKCKVFLCEKDPVMIQLIKARMAKP